MARTGSKLGRRGICGLFQDPTHSITASIYCSGGREGARDGLLNPPGRCVSTDNCKLIKDACVPQSIPSPSQAMPPATLMRPKHTHYGRLRSIELKAPASIDGPRGHQPRGTANQPSSGGPCARIWYIIVEKNKPKKSAKARSQHHHSSISINLPHLHSSPQSK